MTDKATLLALAERLDDRALYWCERACRNHPLGTDTASLADAAHAFTCAAALRARAAMIGEGA